MATIQDKEVYCTRCGFQTPKHKMKNVDGKLVCLKCLGIEPESKPLTELEKVKRRWEEDEFMGRRK